MAEVAARRSVQRSLNEVSALSSSRFTNLGSWLESPKT